MTGLLLCAAAIVRGFPVAGGAWCVSGLFASFLSGHQGMPARGPDQMKIIRTTSAVPGNVCLAAYIPDARRSRDRGQLPPL
jgi:hypothetical protein